ncbi:dihydrofolate reductase [Roseobacter phage RDJL6]|nr:dihydrofolate reductase [Roseobacter phage RDJL6]
MKLVMAVSADGYLAREKNDKMNWLGATDKAVFRILTGVGGHCATSAKTAECMPKTLQGRDLTVLSTKGMTLKTFAEWKPDGWLLGGPSLALQALELDLLTEVHICRSNRYAFPDCMAAGSIPDVVTRFLKDHQRFPGVTDWWHLGLETPVGDLKVERWKRWKSHELESP